MNPILSAVIAAAASTLLAYLTYLASRRNNRADNAQKMIDQHQEDIKELRQEAASQRTEMNTMRRTQRIQGDYIGQLRQHIADGRPPPPPPYPEGLIT